MGGGATERLRTYLAALPPRAQSLLMREFEREESGGDNAAVARFVLQELRRLTRHADENPQPRGDETLRLVFRPLEPFLIEGTAPRAGAIRRNMLLQAWQWLKRDAVAEPLQRLNAALEDTTDASRAADRAFAISDFQRAVAIAMSDAANAPADRIARVIGRIGPTITVEDVASMATLLRARDLFDALSRNLPRAVHDLSGPQLVAVQTALAVPTLQSPVLMPFALALTMKRLAEPWQIIRLATRSTGSDAEHRLLASPYAITIAMAIEHVDAVSARLRDDLKRGQLGSLAPQLATLHDGLRGICAEIDVRPDSAWGRRIAAIRAEVSRTLRTEFESIPMRVRRLLRQRVTADINQSTQLDTADIAQTTALIEFLAAGRHLASELAVNEITTRVWAELEQYVGATSDLLIAALRGCAPVTLDFRRQQVDAAIAFSHRLFGSDHAARMRRSAARAEDGSAAKSA